MSHQRIIQAGPYNSPSKRENSSSFYRLAHSYDNQKTICKIIKAGIIMRFTDFSFGFVFIAIIFYTPLDPCTAFSA
jgi:hypothetical protein